VCFVVETNACQTCGSLGHAHVTHPAGYIASVITAETQSSYSCGSSKCPWKIEVESGQTINVTLLDFALEQRAAGASASAGYVSAENCFRYAVIKESPSHRSIPICGGNGRTQAAYSSVTNVIEVHVVSPEVFSQRGQFLIYHEGKHACQPRKPFNMRTHVLRRLSNPTVSCMTGLGHCSKGSAGYVGSSVHP